MKSLIARKTIILPTTLLSTTHHPDTPIKGPAIVKTRLAGSLAPSTIYLHAGQVNTVAAALTLTNQPARSRSLLDMAQIPLSPTSGTSRVKREDLTSGHLVVPAQRTERVRERRSSGLGWAIDESALADRG